MCHNGMGGNYSVCGHGCRHGDALGCCGRDCQVVAVLGSIGVMGEGPALQSAVVAPLLCTLSVEEQVIVGVEEAVAVAVPYLDGQLL